MTFRGDSPYGTTAEQEDMLLPFDPADVRIAIGSAHVTYLLINGPLTIRSRADIESVIRTIGSRGEVTVALIIQDNGATIDNQVTQIDATSGIRIVPISPGIVAIDIQPGGISAAMLADAIVTGTKIADFTITAQNLNADAVTNANILNGAITTSKIGDSQVTPAKILDFSITAQEMAADAITNTNILDGAITTGKLGATAVTGAKIADDTINTQHIYPGAITPVELDRAYAPVTHYHGAPLIYMLQFVDQAAAAVSVELGRITQTLTNGAIYYWECDCALEGEGTSGTIAVGGIRIRRESAEFGSTYNATFEQGVNSQAVAIAWGVFTAGAGSHVFIADWLRTSGTLHVVGGYLRARLYRIG